MTSEEVRERVLERAFEIVKLFPRHVYYPLFKLAELDHDSEHCLICNIEELREWGLTDEMLSKLKRDFEAHTELDNRVYYLLRKQDRVRGGFRH